MNDKVHTGLGDVQKTLFLPLWGRAVETKKKKPLLVDETAVKVLEQVDFDFSQAAQNVDEISRIAWVKRSLFCDRVIGEFLAKYPAGTVVDIGCGLDTTFERTDNGKLRWYDLDLPDVIELRRKFFTENERRKFIAASFLEEEWLETLEVEGNVLFIAAGVLYYFEEEVIREFFIRLADKYPNSEVLFDASSPLGIKLANKKVIESSGLDERSYLIWGLEDKQDILGWDERIQIIGTYHYYQTLDIGIRNFILGSIADLLKVQYMLHLGLGGGEDR